MLSVDVSRQLILMDGIYSNWLRKAPIARSIETRGRQPSFPLSLAFEYRLPFHSAEQRRRLNTGGS